MRGLWLALVLVVLALPAACSSPAANPTPTETPPISTPTQDATPVLSGTPTASATPRSGSDAVVATLSGSFESGLGRSAFYEGRNCPSDEPSFWLSWTAESRFNERIRDATGVDAGGGVEMRAFRLVVRGELSPPGSYGHLGAYSRELTVYDLLRAELADDCGEEPGEGRVDGEGSAGGGDPEDEPGSAALGVDFTMRVGDEVRVGGTDEALRLAGVTQDSRCPLDVTCVWAGEALLAFELRRGGAIESIAVPVSPDEGVAALGALRVRVLALAPAPRSSGPIAQESYEATVRLEPLLPPPDAESPHAESGVRGVVTLGPLCPVLRAGHPCPDRPLQATLLLVDAAGDEVARTTSGADGAYWLPAPGGNYTLAPQPLGGQPLPSAGSAAVSIRNGHWTELAVSYDSGIR